MQVTLGGERLGAGKRQKVTMREYERSTHDLSYVWRSTMAAGTLVPFMTLVGLPGDTFDIELDCDVLTHPTIGPLFGSYKIQLDIFQTPVRLYQAALHMNMLGIGRDMSKVLLPQIVMQAPKLDRTQPIDNQQINPSSIWSYLGIRGLGHSFEGLLVRPERKFNAIPYLSYWDIYKNYYANKQEEIGAMIHREVVDIVAPALITASMINTGPGGLPDGLIGVALPSGSWPKYQLIENTSVILTGTNLTADMTGDNVEFYIKKTTGSDEIMLLGSQIFQVWEVNVETQIMTGMIPIVSPEDERTLYTSYGYGTVLVTASELDKNGEPNIVTFPLENIDNMRLELLTFNNAGGAGEYLITQERPAPYGLPLKRDDTEDLFSQTFNQEGLALKTYNSDLFNNWISTEWIDGADGISEITAVDTSGGSFTIDELNLSKKIYDMLNRIAISGGSYDDWLDAVYTHDRTRSSENPMYLGGLIQNLVFQEVVSNAESDGQPLGTLAGRGKLGQKRKGGKVIAKIDEPSYLMGIISLTPNIDYSQGNQWDTNLKTMNDFHKPALDEIGFQDLMTDQMAWWDTKTIESGLTEMKSAGKQPAWINYMTNVNVIKGNFADQTQQMFMVLNRRYNVQYTALGVPRISDLTTYIDPSKFNHIFADTRRDAQNFWTQIGVKIEARRKMSAKVIPNL